MTISLAHCGIPLEETEGLCSEQVIVTLIHVIVDIVRDECGPDQDAIERALNAVGQGLLIVARRRSQAAVVSP
jgi:hypothetical protein